MQFLSLLQIIAPIFLVIIGGYVLRKIGVLSAEADKSLIRVVVTMLSPALALDTIVGNEAFHSLQNWILPPLLGFGTVMLGIAVTRLGVGCLKSLDERQKRTFVFTTCLQNYGFIPLPLCVALFDHKATGVLFAFMLGVELAFWTIALRQLIGKTEHGSWKQAINPVVIAIMLAMALNAAQAEYWMPSSLRTSFHMLGACAVPMALMLSGALLADYMNVESLKRGGLTILASSIIRNGIMPILIILVAKFLPLDASIKAVLVLQAAMPAANFPIVVTKVRDGDVPTALQVVMGTSVVGLVTIPIWLGFGLKWVTGP